MKSRRHHNNKGYRQIKRGRTAEQVRRMAGRLPDLNTRASLAAKAAKEHAEYVKKLEEKVRALELEVEKLKNELDIGTYYCGRS